MTTLKIALIGCGNIAPQYVRGCRQFPQDIELVACTDLDMQRAQAFADEYGLTAYSPAALLANDQIDLIINLTIPAAHADVSVQVIEAGKHLYSEKPLATNLADGQRILDAAEKAGVRVGCAPDTFLGGGGQTARKLINEGAIGRPVAATAFMLSHGPDAWHPNPGFFYQAGGGPVMDMAPYYITALVNLLGSVQRVTAFASASFTERTAGHAAIKGQKLPVSVNTHAAATLEFASGALASLIMSFDVWRHNLPPIEVHGAAGSLTVPDPNLFGGTVRLYQPGEGADWQDIPLTHRSDVERGIGVADMARAIAAEAPHRASGSLAYHVLDVMLAIDESSARGAAVAVQSRTDQPAALEPNLQLS